MFEITVIEEYDDDIFVMSHWPISDENVDQEVKDMYDNENRCVELGVILSYSVIAVHEPYNRVETYRMQETLTVQP